MTELPEPLTPAGCDLRDFQRMMIDVTRLRQSSFDAIADDSAWRAGVNLWLSAWHAVPAGSLDDDDGGLAKAAGLGRDLRTWKKVKKDALRGFIYCRDGRLYHETVSEFVLEAWIEKLIQRLSSGAGNAKRWQVEFDAAPIEAELAEAARLLAAIAPHSKSLTKARRRDSRLDPTAIPPGSSKHPTGTPKRSDRDAETVPPRSLEKGTGTGILPPTPVARIGPSRELVAVIEAAGMSAPPSDHPLLAEWLALPDMQLERDILPVIRRVAADVLGRTGRAPFKLRLFDSAIREQHAADEAEIARLRRERERSERMDREQAEREREEATSR